MKLYELFDRGNRDDAWAEEPGKRQPRFPGDHDGAVMQPRKKQDPPPTALELMRSVGINPIKQTSWTAYNERQVAEVEQLIPLLRNAAVSVETVEDTAGKHAYAAPGAVENHKQFRQMDGLRFNFADGFVKLTYDGPMRNPRLSWTER